MIRNILKKDSIVMNSGKSLLQFLIGVSLAYLILGTFEIVEIILGGAAFFLIYSAIYPFNDLMDLEEDKKKNKDYKALVRGDIEKKESISILFLFLTLGIFFLSFLNRWFIIIISVTLLSNFLHSSIFTRLKEKFYLMIINMTILQFLKFSLGWFLLTTNISSFPLFLLLMFSGVYTLSYLLYKGNFRRDIKFKKKLFMGSLGAMVLFFYILSFLFYKFQIPLIILLLLTLGGYVIHAKLGLDLTISGNRSLTSMIYLILVLLIFVFF